MTRSPESPRRGLLLLALVVGAPAGLVSFVRGILLAAAYSLGMGLPFIGFAAGVTRLLRLVDFVRCHGAWVTRIGGAPLITVGPALVTGAWTINWLRATVGPGQIGI